MQITMNICVLYKLINDTKQQNGKNKATQDIQINVKCTNKRLEEHLAQIVNALMNRFHLWVSTLFRVGPNKTWLQPRDDITDQTRSIIYIFKYIYDIRKYPR